MTTKYTCPDCGSDQVTSAHVQMFMVNTRDHYCHSVKTHDPDSRSYCVDCEWEGVRSDLLEVDVPKKSKKVKK